MKRFVFLCLVICTVFAGAAQVELGDDVSIFQSGQGSNVNFSQAQNYSFVGVRSLKTDFGDSNFTVSPESSAGAELDFFDPLTGRQNHVSNFTANAGSEQEVTFNITDLPSDDFYEAYFSGNDTRIFIGYADSPGDEFNFSAVLQNVDISVFNYGEKGVEVENVSFNSSDPVEGKRLKVKTNVSNEGVVEAESPNVTVEAETFNGTQWVSKENLSSVDSVPDSGSIFANVSWDVKPGPWRFNSSADPDDDIKETNESNNYGSALIDVDSYEIFYGDSDSTKIVGDEEKNIYRWDPNQDSGNLYFYDIDSSFDYPDLEPVDGSDLSELDDSLNMSGHNDSIEKLWDRDDDGNIDRFKSMEVGGSTLSVPVANSTDDSEFDTGILYDSGDGNGYDGSQDIIFLTDIMPGTTGSYGTYDYEVRIPFSLGELKSGTDKVAIESQLS